MGRPYVQHHLDRIAAQERLKEAEADRRMAEAEQKRYEQGRAELDGEKEHRRLAWMSAGGDPADFEKAWPQQVSEIMQERLDRRQQQQRASSVWQ